jgi:Uma2 family endonuclease
MRRSEIDRGGKRIRIGGVGLGKIAPMSLPSTAEIFDAAEHLPDGATLIVPEVSWDDYERVLEEFAERPRFRTCYDCGTLEIMSPSNRQDWYAPTLDRLIQRYVDIQKIPVEMYGHTTWKKRALGKGIEADCCYFVKNAQFVAENFGWDVEVGPPPDVAVEIDITNSSLRKLSIYAALRVPEVWRYDGKNLHIYELVEGKYSEIESSRFLPGLNGKLVVEYLELAQAIGQTRALAQFERRLSKTKKPSSRP